MAGKFYWEEDFPNPDRRDYELEKSVFLPVTGKSRFCGGADSLRIGYRPLLAALRANTKMGGSKTRPTCQNPISAACRSNSVDLVDFDDHGTGRALAFDLHGIVTGLQGLHDHGILARRR